MKKFVLMFIALFMTSGSVFADGLTATLQQGDVMTPFYGVDAFKNAYAAAQDGAVITLSSGKFNDVGTVSKQITIIGAYAFDVTSTETTFLGSLTVAAHNIKIEGIYFSGTVTLGTSSLSSITNCTLRKCWIETSLLGSYKHENTLVDQCVIKTEQAMAKSSKYCIKNSTIDYFAEINSTSNIAYIANCVVWHWFACIYSSSKYIENTTYKRPYAIYKNNYLGLYKSENSSITLSLAPPSEFYNNRFCQTYMKKDYDDSEPYSFIKYITISYGTGCVHENDVKGDQKFNKYFEYPAHPVDAPTGSDGTPVGPYGGTGFSEYPAIPRIISKTIDSNSDAEGKINVKITVKAEQ